MIWILRIHRHVTVYNVIMSVDGIVMIHSSACNINISSLYVWMNLSIVIVEWVLVIVMGVIISVLFIVLFDFSVDSSSDPGISDTVFHKDALKEFVGFKYGWHRMLCFSYLRIDWFIVVCEGVWVVYVWMV